MVGPEIDLTDKPSRVAPAVGPAGARGPRGFAGPSGAAELAEVLVPGEAASVDDDGNLVSLPVVRGGAITASSATPTDLPDGSIHVTTAAGATSELYLTPGAGFGQVLTLTAPPSALAPGQVAALVDSSGNVNEIYLGVSA